ncbi:ankyrin repeat protein, putative [Trichomonas vaginalis G3]|uniref:Ankyrin repeat protein, putative n=1 Tax=Trichomonas vaginalis (strain ATCC PRA-98 / G3) TaxID=412133 RepID=A2DJM7_TRIV3|nr:protein ubiquitination [Trichomonas vaginalis G3]EAY19427.1 ankyrin repeat protein, putative [Trichomonas vaginalis G3]KAI5493171.1 protein ubiquitination [Trichomonas vaginalis G3]|eukprot:XP_001580413.1 ankyrin repeat protein [Trichomonas vaginalis G3]
MSAEILLNCGANPNLKDGNQETPLHFAAKSNSLDIVSTLISHGADINAINVNGWTPLHHAYYIKSDEMIQKLIDNGADANIADKNGQIPSEITPPEIEHDGDEDLSF